MSDFIISFLLILNVMAWVRAMISWCDDAHNLYRNNNSVKLFIVNLVILCILVCAGIICTSISLSEWVI